MPQPLRHLSEAAFAADMAACKAMLRGGSRSFYAASFLLPKAVREPAMALYAFCRLADDAVDASGADCAAAITMLQNRIDALYAHIPWDHPADRAVMHVIHHYAIPRASLDALVEGFAWDASARRYDTFEDVLDYAARVAGCVGIMMALVMGVRNPDALARAADLGVAMQLSNIARDVGEDARNGRLYLPRQWLSEAGIEAEAFLANPVFTPALGRVVLRLLAEAETLYARADAGIDMLPPRCRPGIRAARILYAAIGHAVIGNGGNSISSRAVVPMGRKIPLLARSLVATPAAAQFRTAPALASTGFLLHAVACSPYAYGFERQSAPAWWNIGGHVQNALRVIEKLEKADRGIGMRHGW
jgi:15-cis-phytoene synthase